LLGALGYMVKPVGYIQLVQALGHVLATPVADSNYFYYHSKTRC
jgi:hypothetical protein